MVGRWDDRPGHASPSTRLELVNRRNALTFGLCAAAWPGASAAVSRVEAADIPLRMQHNRPWTGVWIDKQGPFRFQIATGANLSLIWRPLAERLKLGTRQVDGLVTRNFEQQYSTIYRAEEVLIGGGLGLTRVDLAGFQTDDEPAFLGALPLMPDRVTAFEFGAGMMRYLPDGPPPVSGYLRAPLAYDGSHLGWTPDIVCKIDGREVRLVIHTGSPDSVTLYPDAVRRLGLWEGAGRSFDRVTRVDAARFKTRIARRGDLEIGPQRFEQPIITLHDPHTAQISGWGDGVIGMDVLRRLDLILDQPRRAFWMRALESLGDPWRHDRAGFQTDYVDRSWQITQVDAGSPAEQAGLTVGDKLANFTEAAIERLRDAQAGKPGARLTFEVLRSEATIKLSMVLQDRV